MNIKTQHVYPPIPDRRFDWSAIDEDTYDGAPDSSNRNQIGWGATEQEAIEDLMNILEEDIAEGISVMVMDPDKPEDLFNFIKKKVGE